MQCPAQLKRSDVKIGTGYKAIVGNIRRFHELQSLPMPVDDDLLNECNGLAETLLFYSYKWHKRCYNKFNGVKLKRAEKRKTVTQNGTNSHAKITRKNSGAIANASFQDK